jgi:hypothetical protein
MKTFKQVIKEEKQPLKEVAKNPEEMDMEFLKRAEIVQSFNLLPSDFTSLDHKAEIQYIIGKNFFPGFDLNNTIPGDSFSVDELNKRIVALKQISKESFLRLHNYPLKGVGPGEATMYFLLDNARLGGGASAGTDLFVGNQGYEIKAVKLSQDGYYQDFKIGGTVDLSPLINNAKQIAAKLKIEVKGTEINKGLIAQIKGTKFKDEWIETVEKPYVEAAAKYFAGHPTMFIIHRNPVVKHGEVAEIKNVTADDIILNNITSGTIKPAIRRG